MMKKHYELLFVGVCIVIIDLSIGDRFNDILPDVIGYALLVYAVMILPVFDKLKRTARNFAILLSLSSVFMTLSEFAIVPMLPYAEDIVDFLFIVFMYFEFQLLLLIYKEHVLEEKTFYTYQRYIGLMLSSFAIHSFVLNVGIARQEGLELLGGLLQVIAFYFFTRYYLNCEIYWRKAEGKS